MSAAGERSLDRLLATLEPRLDAVPYTFATRPEDPPAPLPRGVLAAIREAEGWTLVTAGAGAPREPHGESRVWARILLSVHSDLEAVGLLAAVASRLAERRIPVNALAGWFHDHLFVPWERREEAFEALLELQKEAVAAGRT